MITSTRLPAAAPPSPPPDPPLEEPPDARPATTPSTSPIRAMTATSANEHFSRGLAMGFSPPRPRSLNRGNVYIVAATVDLDKIRVKRLRFLSVAGTVRETT